MKLLPPASSKLKNRTVIHNFTVLVHTANDIYANMMDMYDNFDKIRNCQEIVLWVPEWLYKLYKNCRWTFPRMIQHDQRRFNQYTASFNQGKRMHNCCWNRAILPRWSLQSSCHMESRLQTTRKKFAKRVHNTLSQNTREWVQNAENKKGIAEYFASFFSHFAPLFSLFAFCSILHKKSKDFVVYFFAALIKHEYFVFVVCFAKTLVKCEMCIAGLRILLFRPAIHFSENSKKCKWNAKNKRCITGYFATLFFTFRVFSHFVVRTILRKGQHSRKTSQGFHGLFFRRHYIWMKYEKYLVGVLYFVVFHKNTRKIPAKCKIR